MKRPSVYILRCSDGSYYTGCTSDLEQRLRQHNDGVFSGYTARRRPVTLVHVLEFSTMDEAIRAEKQIKGWSRSKKEAFMVEDFDRLKELAKSHRG